MHNAGVRNFSGAGPGTGYAHPGPGGGRSFTLAQAFNGLSPIGTWNLFVTDSNIGDSGSIPGGWSLDINPDVTPLPAVNPTPDPTPTPAPAKNCKKKKSKKGAAAVKKKSCKKKRKK